MKGALWTLNLSVFGAFTPPCVGNDRYLYSGMGSQPNMLAEVSMLARS